VKGEFLVECMMLSGDQPCVYMFASNFR
jgi:hypothetical protein